MCLCIWLLVCGDWCCFLNSFAESASPTLGSPETSARLPIRVKNRILTIARSAKERLRRKKQIQSLVVLFYDNDFYSIFGFLIQIDRRLRLDGNASSIALSTQQPCYWGRESWRSARGDRWSCVSALLTSSISYSKEIRLSSMFWPSNFWVTYHYSKFWSRIFW